MEQYVTFDLGMVGQLHYYTGIIFRGYADGSGYSILSGGRYDNLVAQYGVAMPAVGMALKLNEVLLAIQKQEIVIEYQKAKTLIAFTQKGIKKAVEIANIYRESGMYIEMSLLGEDIAKNMAYAEKKEMTHVYMWITMWKRWIIFLNRPNYDKYFNFAAPKAFCRENCRIKKQNYISQRYYVKRICE